jgi:hypothetical protein
VPDTRPANLPADELIATLHPYGERSAQHSASAAQQIAELVRYLNHAATTGEGVPDPNTAAAVLAALYTTCTHLPHLLRRLRHRMDAFAADPALATASSTDTASALAARTAASIAEAESALWRLTIPFRTAYQTADQLYLDVDDKTE